MEDLLATRKDHRVSVPELINLSSESGQDRMKHLCTNGVQVVDEYASQLEELFQVENPDISMQANFQEEFQKYFSKVQSVKPLWQQGLWVYYPWRETVVHILAEEGFFKVRTARNKNLITKGEQDKFYSATIGVAGLSVGNSVVMATVVQGGAKHIKLADFDTLELSNTNRIRTGVYSLGVQKVCVTAREIYEINPYAQVDIFEEGIRYCD
jgi:hypothetical protein